MWGGVGWRWQQTATNHPVANPTLAAEVDLDRIPELLGEMERLLTSYAGGGPSITAKYLSNTLSVSGCTVFGSTARR